MDINDEQNQQL